MRVLVLGASGMLGNAVFKYFSGKMEHETWGTLRGASLQQHFDAVVQPRLLIGVDVLDQDGLLGAFARVQPDVVINCVGLIKQLDNAKDPLAVLPVNALLPHRLSNLCKVAHARLIHVSTDCVFSGRRGNYVESDESDAEDLYGKSKYMGELHDVEHAVTLRTSIIGHELHSQHALVDWFLSQQGHVKGYTRAIFSGLPTVELARVMHDWVLPNPALHGLYHVSAKPISKHDLLKLVAQRYGKAVDIQPDEQVAIDRSLDSSRFTDASGYAAPEWPMLIDTMYMNR